jgi:hypothetical protein
MNPTSFVGINILSLDLAIMNTQSQMTFCTRFSISGSWFSHPQSWLSHRQPKSAKANRFVCGSLGMSMLIAVALSRQAALETGFQLKDARRLWRPVSN